MENSKVLPNIRIRRITLTNFRNIIHSTVDLPNGKISDYIDGEPSILGLYGQNGSGKTSLLMALNALKYALSGTEFIFSDFASCVRKGCDSARLEFEFSAYNEMKSQFDIYYAFSLSIDGAEKRTKEKEDSLNEAINPVWGSVFSDKGKNQIKSFMRPKDKRIKVFNEVLQFAETSINGEKSNKQILIDTSDKASKASGKAFGNKTKYSQLTQCSDDGIDEALYKAKIEASIMSTSFIFSSDVVDLLVKGSVKESYKLILRALSEFGSSYLFVILMRETAVNNIHMFPLALWINTPDGAIGYSYPLMLYDHCEIPEVLFDTEKWAIETLSKVMTKIVPNLSIEVVDIGKTIDESGEEKHLFDLISVRNGVRIPFAYESDGIRRIVSTLSLLLAVYNNPSVTVAIDEIDSGVFEYLLGELLSILKDSAKGQLVFTSHNLRPLEVLNYRNLMFTTINPENRFIKLEGISGNNNLRDSYFRNIILGNGENALYDTTDSFEIENAFYSVGNHEEKME